MRYRIINIIFPVLFLVLAVYSQNPSEKEAELAIKTKNFGKAIEIYAKLYEQDKTKLVYLNWVARLLAWSGKYKKSIETFDKVLQIEPNNSEAKIGKSYVLMWQKKYGKAKKILDSSESNISWYLAKINYYRYQNEKKKALSMLLEAKEKFPENAEIKELEVSINQMKTIETEFGCSQNTLPFDLTEKYCQAKIIIKKEKNEFTLKTQRGEQFQRKFNEIGFAIKRELNSNVTIYGGFSSINEKFNYNFGFNFSNKNFTINNEISHTPKATINQNLNFNSSIDYKISEKTSVGTDFRLVKIQDKKVKIFSPRFQIRLDERSLFTGRIYRGNEVSALHNSISIKSFSYSLGYERQFSKPLHLSFIYTGINENLLSKEAISKNKVNAFSAKSNFIINNYLNVETFVGLTLASQAKITKVYGFNVKISR